MRASRAAGRGSAGRPVPAAAGAEVIRCVDDLPVGDQGEYQLPSFVLVNRVMAVRDLQKRPVVAALTQPGALHGSRNSGRRSGLVLGLVSALLFSTSGTFGAALLESDWSPTGAVLARVLMAAAVLSPTALLALRGRWHVVRQSWRQMVIYGMVGVAAVQVAYFNAVARMPVGVAILLTYLAIVFIMAWLWVRHGHRPTLLTMAGGVAALGGLVLMLDLSGRTTPRIGWAGALWGLATAAASTVYFLQSAAALSPVSGDSSAANGVSDALLPPVVLTWGGMLIGAAALGAVGAVGLMQLRMSSRAVVLFGGRVSWAVLLLGLGVLATAIPYVAGIASTRRLGPKLASFVSLAEVPFAVGAAWALLGQVPTRPQFLGGLLILVGVVLVRFDEARSG
jgi:drug/metabolite transporter (DMT)-like permease